MIADALNGPAVAVIGANGRTGQFVVRELLRRRILPVAVGRNTLALMRVDFGRGEAVRRFARLDDASALDRALSGVAAVINCAGPFSETVEAVAEAALRARIHYLDISAEQGSAFRILDAFHAAALEAELVFSPSVAFFGGLPDLMVAAALGDWESVDSVEIFVGLDDWQPSPGMRKMLNSRAVVPLVIRDGRLSALSAQNEIVWHFAAPLGRHGLVELPLSEAILIAAHVSAGDVRHHVSRSALDLARKHNASIAVGADALGRADQQFVIDVVVRRGGEERRASAGGRDIAAISASIVCEAAERLLRGRYLATGARTASEIFDAGDFLATLELHSPDLLVA